MDGIINIYKEKGFTSHDVVAKLRGICGQKKIGHTGTLDPDAVGVLPVCLGKATRVAELLTEKDKEYEAVLRLGVKTDTLDITGQVLEERPVSVSEEDIREAAKAFVGTIRQVPPMYSALKVNGKKLYELARAGKEVEREAREVTIHALEILSVSLPLVTLRVHCSRGTYIRSLCDDLGERLGCGGCMESLIRTRSGVFSLSDALPLSEVQRRKEEGTIEELLIPVDVLFAGCKAYRCPEDLDKRLKNGNPLPFKALKAFTGAACAGLEGQIQNVSKGLVRIYDDEGHFAGLYQIDEGMARPEKVFF